MITFTGPKVSGTKKVAGGKIKISAPPNSASYENEHSESSTSLNDFFSKEGGSVSRSEARCSIYDVTIDIDDPSLKLHQGFIKAIKIIDLAQSKTDKETVMKDFIGKFGTHFSKKTVMGIGTQFETRFTEEETIKHDRETRNECSSNSGGFNIFGFHAHHSQTKCTGSLNDTWMGKDTSVSRIRATSYGTLPKVKTDSFKSKYQCWTIGAIFTFGCSRKGQSISKCLFDVIISTKKPTNFF